MVDNTFATPVLQKPLELGADIVIHSATKYLGGHSDLTAGVLAGSRKWMDLARPIMILTGGCLDPGCAYLLLRGLKTLDVRVERACRNAARIADMLRGHAKVASVYYPGLPDHDCHEIARRQMKDFGMMVSFDLRGGGRRQSDYRQSDIVVPGGQPGRSGIDGVVSGAHFTYRTEREATELLGVSAATVRLSVGIEDSADLIRRSGAGTEAKPEIKVSRSPRVSKDARDGSPARINNDEGHQPFFESLRDLRGIRLALTANHQHPIIRHSFRAIRT